MKFKLGIKIWKNKPKAVLFDMDGVLIDSVKLWQKSLNITLKKFGSKTISKKDFVEKYWGESVSEIIGSLKYELNNPKLNEEAVEFCKKQFSELGKKSRLFPGARNSLAIVKKKFRTALVTNTARHDVFEILKRLEIEKYFDVVISIDDVKKGKPDPEPVKRACKVLRTSPKKAVLIGDTLSDLKSGRGAGCKVIGVRIDADERIDKISDLAKKLGLKD